MPDYSPLRDFIGAVLACFGMVAIAIIGSAILASCMERIPA